MKKRSPMRGQMVLTAALLCVCGVSAQDWPQWRGPNRDAKATDFKAPATWPKELTKKWSVKVGNGVATPALVGHKLYVHARVGGDEVTRCLQASDGKELWQDKYPAKAVGGPASGFPGPRSSPAVAEGKVVTLGVEGVLSCLDAATGKVEWRKDDTKGKVPQFATSCSPIIVDGLCVVQLGGGDRGQGKGLIVAYELASGNEKWKFTEDGTAYSSPVVQVVDGSKTIVAETAANIVGLNAADGKLLWKTPFAVKGRGYAAATPVINGEMVVMSGAGQSPKAARIGKGGTGFVASEAWTSADNATVVIYNTPVLKNGYLYGISTKNEFFCVDAGNGKTTWTAAAPPLPGTAPGRQSRDAGYGSVVDAGSVLIGLTLASQLVVYEPNPKEFKQIASYKVAQGGTHAYPVVSGNRVFVKDADSLTLWTVE